MAFHFFLSLLPLLVFIGYVLGLIAQRKGASAVFGLLLHNLPATTEAVLQSEVLRLATADRLGPLAAIGFLWIASGGMQGLMQAIERVVGVPRRAWWKQRLLALGWVIGTLVAFAIASFGVIEWENVVNVLDEVAEVAPSASERAPVEPWAPTPPQLGDRSRAPQEVALRPTRGESAKRPGGSGIPEVARAPARGARNFLRSGGDRVLTVGLSLAVAVGWLAAFYRFAVAHTPHVRRRLFPGAFVAIALVIVISWGFSVYVRTLASYTLYYGSLAAIAVLLIWLWLMSLAILVGAELNSQLEGLRDLTDDEAGD